MERGLKFSNSSTAARTLLQFSIRIPSLEIPLLHFLRSYLRFLNLRHIRAALEAAWQGLFQLPWTTSMKPWCCTQKLSNLKTLLAGMADSIQTMHGMWSEIGFPWGRTTVLGHVEVQFIEVKNQSICSNSGSCCILLQEKRRPLIGSSMRDCARMNSFKSPSSNQSSPSGIMRSKAN